MNRYDSHHLRPAFWDEASLGYNQLELISEPQVYKHSCYHGLTKTILQPAHETNENLELRCWNLFVSQTFFDQSSCYMI